MKDLKFRIAVQVGCRCLCLLLLTSLVVNCRADISLRPDKSWFAGSHFGLFCVYALGTAGGPRTIYFDGTSPSTLDELADGFNADLFARDLHDARVDYVVFTAMPSAGDLFYPSDTIRQSRGGIGSRRDLIADLITALKPFDIRLILDVSVADGAELPLAEQLATGWNNSANGYSTWNAYMDGILEEMGERYGAGIAGYWLDSSAMSTDFTKIDANRLKASLLFGDPDRVIVAASSTSLPAQLLDEQYVVAVLPKDVEHWPAASCGVMAQISTGAPWATTKRGDGSMAASPENLFRYLVLQSALCSSEAGLALGCGPYAGAEGGWEDGIAKCLKALGKYIRPISESLKTVKSSTAYPTAEDATLTDLPFGIAATESLDGKYEYIHVLNPPAGKSLALPAPAGGEHFADAVLLSNRHRILMQQTPTSLSLTLGPNDSWDALDTVVRLVGKSP